MPELSAEVVAFLSGGHPHRQGRVCRRRWPPAGRAGLVPGTGRSGRVQHRKDSAKGRAFARDSRVVLCVDDERPPFGFVQIQGEVRLSEDPDELLDTAVRLGTRYMGEQRGAEFGRRNAVPGELVVWLRPTKVLAAFNLTERASGGQAALDHVQQLLGDVVDARCVQGA